MIRQVLASLTAAAMLGLVALNAAAAGDGPACSGPGCGAPACGDCLHKVCKPTTDTKKHEHRCYTSKCEDFCLPNCCGLHGGCKKCDSGCETGACGAAACGPKHSCGHPMVRKPLIVRIKSEEVCVNKCEVVTEAATCAAPVCKTTCAPACVPDCGPAIGTIAPPKTK